MIIQSNRYYISISSDGIYLNNQKFIDKKAELQFIIFRILLKNFSENIIDYCDVSYVPIREINACLRKRDIFLNDHETQIRKAIYIKSANQLKINLIWK